MTQSAKHIDLPESLIKKIDRGTDLYNELISAEPQDNINAIVFLDDDIKKRHKATEEEDTFHVFEEPLKNLALRLGHVNGLAISGEEALSFGAIGHAIAGPKRNIIQRCLGL